MELRPLVSENRNRPRTEQAGLFDEIDTETNGVGAQGHAPQILQGTEERCAEILFGQDPMERIVAIEPGETHVTLWRRLEDGSIEALREPFRPWILLTGPYTPPPHAVEMPMAPGSLRGIEPILLEGEGYRCLYEFPGWRAFQDARFLLRDEHVAHLTYPSAARLYLIRSGKTLFKGMTMQDVVRMQVDIETCSLSYEREEDRILMIAVRDNRGLLEVLTGDEREMLNRLVSLVQERDPDIIEGHNLFGFDFPFLMARAHRHNIRLALGRDGSEARVGAERNFAIGGISRPFTPIYLYGRHVIDTYLAVQRFDWARGSLSSYGLKEAARAFGIAESDRVEIPRAEMERFVREDPARVIAYAQQDVIETARLAELVTATEFYQTQMVPDSYGAAAVSGTGEKINALFLRAYLAAGQAIPFAQTPRPYPGGYTEVCETGVLDRVVKADVESLYPSIMLARKIRPANDRLGIFLPMLAELTRRRLEAKARAQSAQGAERHYWDGLQGSFKVLINSFYGYLGAPGCHFNDYDAAAAVTEIGREIVQKIAEELRATGSRLIEIDTDGVYFVPPETVQGEQAERAYVERIGATLPQGIRLAFDGRYKAMVSLKTKNYVLYGYDGKKTFKGASLRSRADEPYGREFLAKAIDLLLEHRLQEIGELYAQTLDDILQRRIPIEKLARRERITEKTVTSASRQRLAEVTRDVAVGEYVQVYERANGRMGLLQDYEANGQDVNTTYYMDKLYKFACRLREAFGKGFDACIPKPTPLGAPQRVQASLDLFDE
jgi:DNA polymerase elongation subunit (family B)